jgi:hypothetical protein
MDVGGYHHLPAVQDDRQVGMLSICDMLRQLTRLCKGA